jgi:membrane-bound ClpP family serine protease
MAKRVDEKGRVTLPCGAFEMRYDLSMRIWLALMFTLAPFCGSGGDSTSVSAPTRKVYVLPVRDDIMPPLVYIVRRGVKEAIEAKPTCLVLDMETNGGRLGCDARGHRHPEPIQGRDGDLCESERVFGGEFIAVATQKIYMAPQSVIGARRPS